MRSRGAFAGALLVLLLASSSCSFVRGLQADARVLADLSATERLLTSETRHAVSIRLQGRLQTTHHLLAQKATVDLRKFIDDIVRPFVQRMKSLVGGIQGKFTSVFGDLSSKLQLLRKAWTDGQLRGKSLQHAMAAMHANLKLADKKSALARLMAEINARKVDLESGFFILKETWHRTWQQINDLFKFRQRDLAMVLANGAARRARRERAPAFIELVHDQLHQLLQTLRHITGEPGGKLIDPLYKAAGNMLVASFAETEAQVGNSRTKKTSPREVLSKAFGPQRADDMIEAISKLNWLSRIPEMYTVGYAHQLSAVNIGFEITFDAHLHQMQGWIVLGALLGMSDLQTGVTVYHGVGFRGSAGDTAFREKPLKDACAGWSIGAQGAISVPVTGIGPLGVSLGGVISLSATGPSPAKYPMPPAGNMLNTFGNVVRDFSTTPSPGCSFLSVALSGSLGFVPLPKWGGDAFISHYLKTEFQYDCSKLQPPWSRPSLCTAALMLVTPGAWAPGSPTILAAYAVVLGNTKLFRDLVVNG